MKSLLEGAPAKLAEATGREEARPLSANDVDIHQNSWKVCDCWPDFIRVSPQCRRADINHLGHIWEGTPFPPSTHPPQLQWARLESVCTRERERRRAEDRRPATVFPSPHRTPGDRARVLEARHVIQPATHCLPSGVIRHPGFRRSCGNTYPSLTARLFTTSRKLAFP
jgi:hypothetical protein